MTKIFSGQTRWWRLSQVSQLSCVQHGGRETPGQTGQQSQQHLQQPHQQYRVSQQLQPRELPGKLVVAVVEVTDGSHYSECLRAARGTPLPPVRGRETRLSRLSSQPPTQAVLSVCQLQYPGYLVRDSQSPPSLAPALAPVTVPSPPLTTSRQVTTPSRLPSPPACPPSTLRPQPSS